MRKTFFALLLAVDAVEAVSSTAVGSPSFDDSREEPVCDVPGADGVSGVDSDRSWSSVSPCSLNDTPS